MFDNLMHKFITAGCILTGILVCIGIISLFFSPAIEAALTLPPARPGIQSTQPTASSSIQGNTTTTTATGKIIARDTFQRPDQAFWGTSSDGQQWNGDAHNTVGFTIVNHTGHVANNMGVFTAILGPSSMDAEVTFTGSLSSFATSNIGAVLRWVDANNWYKAYLDGKQLVLMKKVAGTITQLAAVPFPVQGYQPFSLRFRVMGNRLAVRAWLSNQTEPGQWMVTTTDQALTAGAGGIRLLLQNRATCTITMFEETRLTISQQ